MGKGEELFEYIITVILGIGFIWVAVVYISDPNWNNWFKIPVAAAALYLLVIVLLTLGAIVEFALEKRKKNS